MRLNDHREEAWGPGPPNLEKLGTHRGGWGRAGEARREPRGSGVPGADRRKSVEEKVTWCQQATRDECWDWPVDTATGRSLVTVTGLLPEGAERKAWLEEVREGKCSWPLSPVGRGGVRWAGVRRADPCTVRTLCINFNSPTPRSLTNNKNGWLTQLYYYVVCVIFWW